MHCIYISKLINVSPTMSCSCHGCGESLPPPPLPTTPDSVLAACLLKRHLDGKPLNWREILKILPDQVCECYSVIPLSMYVLNYVILHVKIVFILVDLAVRLIVFPAPHLIDLIKVHTVTICCIFTPPSPATCTCTGVHCQMSRFSDSLLSQHCIHSPA